MNPRAHESDQPVKPEELTAFVDGLLPDRDRIRVEAWLTTHPDLADEVAGQRRVMQTWNDAAPPLPSERAWRVVERDIQMALVKPGSGPPRHRPPIRLWSLTAGGLVAASLLAAVIFQDRGQVTEPGAIFAVTAEKDVEIQSMQVSDHDSLLVGRWPMVEPMVFVSAGDVHVEELEEDTDGMRPQVLMDDNSSIPMVVVPMTSRR